MIIFKLLLPFLPILIVGMLCELMLVLTPVKRVYRLANFILLLGEFISCLIIGSKGWNISSHGPLQNWVLILLAHIALMIIVSFIIMMYYIVSFKKNERYALKDGSLENKEKYRFYIIGVSLFFVLLMIVNAITTISELQKELSGNWRRSLYDKCEDTCLYSMTFDEDNIYSGVNEMGQFEGEYTITLGDSVDHIEFTNFPYGNNLFEIHVSDNYSLFGGASHYRTVSFGNDKYSFYLYE